MSEAGMRVLIFDDRRTIQEAIRATTGLPDGIGKWGTKVMVRPPRWDGEKLVEDFENAFDTIRHNDNFDVLILDNDLGVGVEGYRFLMDLIEKMPAKVPIIVKSCSSNPDRRIAIESYHQNWLRSLE